LCLVGNLAAAVPPVQALDIPAELEPWKAWVLHDNAEQQCPPHFDDGTIRRCWWPSRLELDVGDRGGLFEQQVTVYAPTWVTLPGDETHWPESVSAGGEMVPVVGRNGRPCIWLEPGDYPDQGCLRLEYAAGNTPGAGFHGHFVFDRRRPGNRRTGP
jgi:hypothetical protein